MRLARVVFLLAAAALTGCATSNMRATDPEPEEKPRVETPKPKAIENAAVEAPAEVAAVPTPKSVTTSVHHRARPVTAAAKLAPVKSPEPSPPASHSGIAWWWLILLALGVTAAGRKALQRKAPPPLAAPPPSAAAPPHVREPAPPVPR